MSGMEIRKLRVAAQLISAGVAAVGVAFGLKVVVPGIAAGCAGIIDTGTVLLILPVVAAGLVALTQLTAIALVGWIVPAILVGGSICGWICPLGLVQDALEGLGSRLGLIVHRPPGHEVLLYLRYVILVATLVLGPFATYKLWYKVCPMHYLSYILLGRQEIGLYSALKMSAAFGILGASVFVPRFVCRYICPVGVLLRLANGWSLLDPLLKDKTELVRKGCKGCKVCTVCPKALDPAEAFPNDFDCMRCGRCLNCPIHLRMVGEG
ncbi:4Fe-4S binding protein [Methanopyrus sp. SNP6]|uniref:4Fe-4S binding protein n=1 Tax=Methanopyrus sp. SNP6 TaxID=1937005 RepID=UPI0011E5C811|nr:4Fe-4S binding protein [Methanopyrus sp. SNP6]